MAVFITLASHDRVQVTPPVKFGRTFLFEAFIHRYMNEVMRNYGCKYGKAHSCYAVLSKM